MKTLARVHFALLLALSTTAVAGPYSSISGVTPGAPDNPIAKASLSLFESTVVSYAPAPGVGASFRNPTTGFGSLGELYSPTPKPAGPNTPFDKRYRPETGAEPAATHNGAAVSPFGGNINDPADSYGFIGLDAAGSITLGFGVHRIVDGPGADFAVFENGFSLGGPNSLVAELAYVEVSTNGVHFARFASISLNTAPAAVSGAFQGYDVTNVKNLAGKHASGWGTPFDLSELAADPLVLAGTVDLTAIKYVRLVDVVGTGELLDAGGSVLAGIARDSLGNPILDNYITFDSAGFDYLGLPSGAVGLVHHAVPEPASIALLFTGAAALIAFRFRRR